MASIGETGDEAFSKSAFIGWKAEGLPWPDPNEQPQRVPDRADSIQHTWHDKMKAARAEILAVGLAVTLGSVALTGLAVNASPASQRPTFSATKVGNCYVSDDWKWVYPEGSGGIHDLILRNVDGVTAEYGKGSECMLPAALVIEDWANHDGNRLNDMDVRPTEPDTLGQPIVVWGEPYAVPQFATLKPQG